MTALVDIVSYEKEVELKILTPKGEPTGITFWHTSMQAARPSAYIASEESQDEPKGSRRWWAHAITRWEWGEVEYEAGKGAPELSIETATEILSDPRLKWVWEQLHASASALGNFTADLSKGSPKPSGKTSAGTR